MVQAVNIKSPEFDDGGEIPERYGYKRDNANPPIVFEDVPSEAESLALVMDDPDAVEPAGKVWDHWVLWNIETSVSEVSEGSVPPGAVEGQNDYGDNGYGGPNPPDKEHTYIFKLYALDTKLELAPGSTKKGLEQAIEGHVIKTAVLKGRYAPV